MFVVALVRTFIFSFCFVDELKADFSQKKDKNTRSNFVRKQYIINEVDNVKRGKRRHVVMTKEKQNTVTTLSSDNSATHHNIFNDTWCHDLFWYNGLGFGICSWPGLLLDPALCGY